MANYRDPNAGPFLRRLMFLTSLIFRQFDSLTQKVATAGNVADFVLWGKTHGFWRDGPTAFRPFSRREDLWSLMSDHFRGGQVRLFEFGVAWGYGTAWWLNHIRDPLFRVDAFDLFTGLPRQWRNYSQGAFASDGTPPDIPDNRVRFHVGDVADTIKRTDLQRSEGDQWCVLFDMDLFEPSLIVWDSIRPLLKQGDILYFDEAFDRDERHLLDHHIFPSCIVEFIGATPTALALRVQSLLDD